LQLNNYGISSSETTNTFADDCGHTFSQAHLSLTFSNGGNLPTDSLAVSLSGTNTSSLSVQGTLSDIPAAGEASVVVVPVAGLDTGNLTATVSTGVSVTSKYNVRTTSGTSPSLGWQGSTTFSNLQPDSAYYVYACPKENVNCYAGVVLTNAYNVNVGIAFGDYVVAAAGGTPVSNAPSLSAKASRQITAAYLTDNGLAVEYIYDPAKGTLYNVNVGIASSDYVVAEAGGAPVSNAPSLSAKASRQITAAYLTDAPVNGLAVEYINEC
jgi:hypothetical protein